jgi:ankyrin repeat protein
LDKGANVNTTNAMGSTSLIYAATFNRTEIAKMLLVKGADASVKDSRGQTAYDHAKMQGNSLLMELLEPNS